MSGKGNGRVVLPPCLICGGRSTTPRIGQVHVGCSGAIGTESFPWWTCKPHREPLGNAGFLVVHESFDEDDQ